MRPGAIHSMIVGVSFSAWNFREGGPVYCKVFGSTAAINVGARQRV